MRSNILGVLLVLLAAMTGLVGLRWWIIYDPTAGMVKSVPGLDNCPPHELRSAASETEQIVIGGIYRSFGDVDTHERGSGSWPRFRGAAGNNIAGSATRLADRWPESGPPVLWTAALGEGHAGAAVKDGRVYVLDYDETERADLLRCFSLADGRELWRRGYGVRVKRNHGKSRTIPAVAGGYVVTIGPRCHVMCADAVTGAFLWGIDLEREYGAPVPLWYAGQCPLIEDGNAIIAVGGPDVLMLAVECATGRIIWEAPNEPGWQMSHTSIVPVVLNGRRMYVYSALGGVAGVAADGGEAGRILWRTSGWSPRVSVPSPVTLDNGRIFLTAGYGAGSAVLDVRERGGVFTAEILREYRPRDGLACEIQTPVHYGGNLYGVLPNDAGKWRQQFVCARPEGDIIWSSGKENRFGMGPFLAADDKFFILSDDGWLNLAAADASGYVLLDRAKVLDGVDAWAPMAIAGRRLILRDSRNMVCLDVGAGR